MNAQEPTDIGKDLQQLLEVIELTFGYDFRHYAKASLKRRVNAFAANYDLNSYAAVQKSIVEDEAMFAELLRHLSVTVSEMFRDPSFYRSFSDHIVPILKTFPFIKIWCAGCARGEEPYSLAILLHEAGLLQKTTLYATDFNNLALETAKRGIFPAHNVKKYIDNYNKFGGKADFADYYVAKYDAIKLADFLRDSITFAHHNLVTDASIGEMNVILCRNVMIYFDESLTNQVLTMFTQSLRVHGYLCIGTKESLQYTSVTQDYDVIDQAMKIYKKL